MFIAQRIHKIQYISDSAASIFLLNLSPVYQTLMKCNIESQQCSCKIKNCLSSIDMNALRIAIINDLL